MSRTASSPARPTRIGFLFNHDQLHQIAHSAPIAFAMSRLGAEVEVTLLATSQAQLDYLIRLGLACSATACRYQLLSLNPALAFAAPLLDALMPYRRVAMLLSNRAVFEALDVLVVPEKTSLMLRSLFGLDRLKFVYTSHGGGDRAVGFDKHSDQFDLAFMSGPKILDRLRRAGRVREGGYAIIGYPKFDLHVGQPARKLFDNDRPTVLYNPHFSPQLSSWYEQGREVLEYFLQSKQYNLIFAPHVMLFSKTLHLATGPLRIERPGAVPERYRHCPHLLIDTGSERSVDMSYTRSADLYLGDVSSQVYEFLHRPRPCLFLNTHRASWRDDENYAHWQAGPVTEDVGQLDAALELAFASHESYCRRQERMFAWTFDLSDIPSSHRAADAILEFALRIPVPSPALVDHARMPRHAVMK